MSEYHYYEFVAIDKPLTLTQMAELRSRSSRTRITQISLVTDRHGGRIVDAHSKDSKHSKDYA